MNEISKQRDDMKMNLLKKEEDWTCMFKGLYNISMKSDFHKELKYKLH